MANQTCNPSILTQALGITATGPRTVIVPADPIIWDAETSYEYLTLVASTDFGQGYVSKKDVPAGTPLTNTDYWIPVASFNAQLSTIQEQLANIQSDMSGKAPTNHASEDTTYGIGTGISYGHVKLTDTYSGESASDGVATSPSGVAAIITNQARTKTIEDYGCTTGADDNTTNFQTAMNDAAANGYVLIIPKGTYKCTGILYIPNYLTMIGVSRADSVINFTSDNGQFKSPNDGQGYAVSASVYLANFTVLGNYLNWSTSQDIGTSRAAFEIMLFGSMENIIIKRFETGIRTVQVMTNPTYNDYNWNYGEIKSFKNINIEKCSNGFICREYDCFINNLNVGWFYANGLTGSCTVNGLHLWGFYGMGYLPGNKPASNIEIESQLPITSGTVQPYIGIFNDVILNNVTLWGMWDLSAYSDYPHPYILCQQNDGVVQINNLTIDYDVHDGDTSKLQRAVFNPGDMTMFINGSISKAFTGFRTEGNNLPTNLGNRTGTGGYIANFIGNTAINAINAANAALKYTTENF